MADPATMGTVGMGLNVLGGITGAAGAENKAAGQVLGIQGQMLATIGQAFGFKAQAQQYDYQANINKYQAAVADLNQQISEQNATYARDVGEVEAQQAGMKHRAELSEMITTQGASGIDVSSGSSTRVRESMIELGYYDQMQTRASAAKTAYGFEIEATMNKAQADVYRYTATMNEDQAKNALTAAGIVEKALPLQQQAISVAQAGGNIGALGSLVGAAGSVASKWVQGSSAMSGMFG